MRTVDLVVLILLIFSGGLVTWAHFDIREDCLTMVKPKTDSTPSRIAAKFTGDYERTNGVVFCLDTNGDEYAYRNIKL